ncbi:hypothetical protein [Clostridium tunisiense]|uniref:hypothetical protein n=1 Tax=Clostridium tunisiense TaxID=219748 RepID=UPI0002E92FF0|nr:hypothetical protein [Clostridium tunisiense]
MAYKATKSRDKGKESYTIIFRHPVKKDPRGKYGLRVRRGLGTKDEEEAERLVEQMNQILSDEFWWDINKKDLAYSKFTKNIVDAFYDLLESEEIDYAKLLDSCIILPKRKDGYSTASLIGPSGAGKTSILRNLMGTENDRFPTTSTGRTTTCDMEIVFDNTSNEYELVVTFMSKALTMLYVEECVQNAISYIVEYNGDVNENEVTDRLLTHKELTVRLSYILGSPTMIKEENSEWDDEENVDDADEFEEISNNKNEIIQMIDKINMFVKRIFGISKQAKEYIRTIKEDEIKKGEKEDSLSNILELFLDKSEEYHNLIEDILDEIQDRFHQLDKNTIVSETRGWINVWTYKTNNKTDFIKVARRFSSNNKAHWGTLLTPLVKGMRIKGPFKPEFCKEFPNIVLIDGVGLGHKTTSTSISTDITSRFAELDTIILVDNATSPIMENSKIAIKTIIDSGNGSKLAICFTHMDLVKGDNFISGEDKVKHVTSSLTSYITSLREQEPPVIAANIENKIVNNCFYLWNLHDKIKSSTQKQIMRLVESIEKSKISNITVKDVTLHYDILMLYPYIQNAIKGFRNEWDVKLGIPMRSSNTEHWTRIKALSRRLAYFDQDHYNNSLTPVADMLRVLTAQLSIFISNPSYYIPKDTPKDTVVEITENIKSSIYTSMHVFFRNSLWKTKLKNWEIAYEYRGDGSTYDRAKEIYNIFQKGAPILDNYSPNMNHEEKLFVQGIVTNVVRAIEESKGKVIAFNYSLEDTSNN